MSVPLERAQTNLKNEFRSVVNALMELSQSIQNSYGSVDAGMLIAASTISICVLMTLAILSQGSSHSIFRKGLKINSGGSKDQREKEEKELEEAEEEIFGNKARERGVSSADIGIQAFMKSNLPTATCLLLVLVVVGSAFHANKYRF